MDDKTIEAEFDNLPYPSEGLICPECHIVYPTSSFRGVDLLCVNCKQRGKSVAVMSPLFHFREIARKFVSDSVYSQKSTLLKEIMEWADKNMMELENNPDLGWMKYQIAKKDGNNNILNKLKNHLKTL